LRRLQTVGWGFRRTRLLRKRCSTAQEGHWSVEALETTNRQRSDLGRSRRALPVVLVAALALTGCPRGEAGPDDNGETAAATPTAATAPVPATATPEGEPATQSPTHGTGQRLRVGVRTDLPGIGLMTDGEPSGFGVDVAAYVAAKLGYSPYDIEWVEARPERREELLETGAVDFVVGAYSISDERAASVAFAGPYLIAGQSLLVRAEDTEINGPDDLAGKTVCEIEGSTEEGLLQELVPDVQLVQETSSVDCAQRLVAGTVDAVFSDDFILAGIAASDDYFALVRLVDMPGASERYAIGLPRGETARCEEITAALAEMYADGSWQRFIDRHTIGTGFVPDPTLNPPTPEPCA